MPAPAVYTRKRSRVGNRRRAQFSRFCRSPVWGSMATSVGILAEPLQRRARSGTYSDQGRSRSPRPCAARRSDDHTPEGRRAHLVEPARHALRRAPGLLRNRASSAPPHRASTRRANSKRPHEWHHPTTWFLPVIPRVSPTRRRTREQRGIAEPSIAASETRSSTARHWVMRAAGSVARCGCVRSPRSPHFVVVLSSCGDGQRRRHDEGRARDRAFDDHDHDCVLDRPRRRDLCNGALSVARCRSRSRRTTT